MIKIKGILTDGQLNKLDKLTFYKEERLLLNKIRTWTKRTRLYIEINLFAGILMVLGTFIALVVTSRFSNISEKYITYFFMLLSFFAVVDLLLIYMKKVRSVNFYHRMMTDLYDHLLKFILDNYRLSLAELIPNFPNVKEISEDMGRAGLSSANYYDAMGVLGGIILGGFSLILYFFISGDVVYLRLSLITFLILGSFGLFLYLGKKFSQARQIYRVEADKFDQAFKDSEPLLVRTQIDYETSNYEKYLEKVVTNTDHVNLVSEINVALLPIFLLFLPYALNIKEGVLSYILIGLFVSGKLFGRSLIISQKADLDISEVRQREVSDLLDLILSINSELTPAKYEEIKEKYLKGKSDTLLKHSILNEIEKQGGEGVSVKNLEYVSGRIGQKKVIKANDLLIPSGKVSFLIGDSGIGKSIFGRLLTLRYADFSADFIGINDSDFRTFPNLEESHRYLHFSGLRNVSTSYRNAISVYIKNYWAECLFIKRVENYNGESDKLRTHFIKNSDYYGGTILPLFNKYHDILILGEYSEDQNKNNSHYYYLGQLFKYMHTDNLFTELVNKSRREFGETKFKTMMADLLRGEYFAFNHLLSYIPEASLYFMDAVLSEPPISQGQRRRILYALDVFMKGKVFVVDEPFSNLDVGTSINIFKDLVHYAKTYGAVVLVLDQKIFGEVYEKFKSEFGLILSFRSNEAGLYNIAPVENLNFAG